jgi:hypothetical protein
MFRKYRHLEDFAPIRGVRLFIYRYGLDNPEGKPMTVKEMLTKVPNIPSNPGSLIHDTLTSIAKAGIKRGLAKPI